MFGIHDRNFTRPAIWIMVRWIVTLVVLIAVILMIRCRWTNLEPIGPDLLTSGRVVFSTDRDSSHGHDDGNFEIYAIDLGANDLLRLTNNPYNDVDATWAPDGSRIAFSSDRSGDYEIYAMQADGSNVERLTSDPADDLSPSWSSDGTLIAFNSDRGGNRDVYVMNSDGSGVSRLTHDPGDDLAPSISPDGSLIAFESDRTGNFEIFVMKADGSDVERLTDNRMWDRRPTWSKDGGRIVFETNRRHSEGPLTEEANLELYEMNADGTGVARLTFNPTADTYPSWSPDGTGIVFVRGFRRVYAMNSDGSGVTRLTDGSGWVLAPSWTTQTEK